MSEDAEYSLVYPFVACASEGGPYEDRAYVAGVEFGTIAAKLEAAPPEATEMGFTVRTGNVPQLDLAAAHSRWMMRATPWEVDPSWSFVIFRRAWSIDPREDET